MTFHDVTMTSQSSHLEFRASILNPENAVIHLTMTTSKNISEFVLRNILIQSKHKKVKDYLPLTNEGKKLEEKD